MPKKPFKRSAILAALWLVLTAVAAVSAHFYLSEKSETMDFQSILNAPSSQHIFGTDALGRDLFSRVACGASVSLGVALLAVALALLIGTALGSIAGYFGGFCERVLMDLTDIMLCFPTFFLLLSVVAILGSDIINIIFIIGVTSWMSTARLIRAEILSLKEREFILAARALGATNRWIILKHLVPNAMRPVIVNAVLGISSAILLEGGLSFLGIGVQPPTPSWGNILMDGKATLGVAWWLTFFPGLVIFLTVLCANILGEALQ